MKLDGVKVVDLSLFLPGPHLTQMMCDHGAEVICVEPPPEGEPSRKFGPVKDGHTPWFRNTHRGKKSLCLNLKTVEAKEILIRLCKEADVFVEAFRPGVTEKLGCSYEQLKKINPGIVYCSITAFGQYGSYKNRPAHNLSIEAMSGLSSANLGDNGKPSLPAVPAADMAASLMAFGGIMMALYRREKSGQGDYLDISMQDALMGWTQNIVGPIFAENEELDVKNERLWGGRGFYNIYETSDGRYISLSGNEPKFVETLLNALERKDLIELAKGKPGNHQAPVIDFLRDTFKKNSFEYWEEWFADKDVCYGPVLTLKEAFDDAHVKERNMIVSDDNGNKHIGIPIKFSEEPGQINFSVPELNEDAESLLTALGYSIEQLNDFRRSSVMPAEKENE